MAEQNGSMTPGPNYFRTVLGYPCNLACTAFFALATSVMAVFSKDMAHAIGRTWGRCVLWVYGIRISVSGLENIDRNQRYVFVSNHQSHLDIPCLFSSIPHNLVFLAKKELFLIPIFGWGLHSAGHIGIDRSSARKARMSFSQAVQHLRDDNISLGLFPEGTRTPDGEVKEFKRGSFALPMESGLDVVPVAIDGMHEAMPKKSLAIRPGTVQVRIGTPIPVSGLKSSDKEALASGTRGAIVSMMR